MDAPVYPSARRTFGDLQGHELICEGGDWRRCTHPEEFADYLEAENERRGWYMSVTTRRGVSVKMKRPTAGWICLTTDFAPWLSEWTAAEFAAGRDPRAKLARIRNGWLSSVLEMLAGKRHILGYAFHADTDDLHFDLILSRQDGRGNKIGSTGLYLMGPWCVSTDRQKRSGAQISPEKRDRIDRDIANFRRRYGDSIEPMDISLARALDKSAETVLGQELTPFRDAYAVKV